MGKISGQKKLTRTFWREVARYNDLCISQTVIDELSRAKEAWQREYLAFIQGIELLTRDAEVGKIAVLYLDEKIIPRSKANDAAHLATACRYHIPHFVSWNMEHLVRPRKIAQIIECNRRHGIFIPTIVKPSDFLNAII